MRSTVKRLAVLAALCILPFVSSGCIATAFGAERDTTVNWKEKCADKCAGKTYPITMYNTDGKVDRMRVAIYDFSNNIGCFCPLQPGDK